MSIMILLKDFDKFSANLPKLPAVILPYIKNPQNFFAVKQAGIRS